MRLLMVWYIIVSNFCTLHAMNEEKIENPHKNLSKSYDSTMLRVIPRSPRTNARARQSRSMPPLDLSTLNADDGSIVVNDAQGLLFLNNAIRASMDTNTKDSPRRIKVSPRAIDDYAKNILGLFPGKEEQIIAAFKKLKKKDPVQYQDRMDRILRIITKAAEDSDHKQSLTNSGESKKSLTNSSNDAIDNNNNEITATATTMVLALEDQVHEQEERDYNDLKRNVQLELLEILKDKFVFELEEAKESNKMNKIALVLSVLLNIGGIGATIGLAVWAQGK